MRARVAAVGETLAALAIVLWVGGHGALGAFAARIVFADVPRPLAAPTMARVFREFDRVIAVGVIVVVAGVLARFFSGGGRRRTDLVVLGAALLLAALGAFEVAWLHPRIEQLFVAGRSLDPEFASLHRLSERAGHLELLFAVLFFGACSFGRRAPNS